jgi:hypothetical protein
MDITRSIRDDAPMSDDARVNAFRSLVQDIEAFRLAVDRSGGRIPMKSALDIALQTTTRVAPYFVTPQSMPVRISELTEGLHVAFMMRAYTFAVQNGVVGVDKWFGQWHGEDIMTSRPGKQTQARDFAWEFVAASMCSRFAQNTRHAEPDVRCEFDGERWGIACKVLYTNDPDTQIDRMVEGAKQIAKCPDLDHGAVLVNVTPLLRHGLWRRDRIATRDEAYELFSADVTRIASEVHRDKLYQRFLPRANADCFMFFGQTLFDVDDFLGLTGTGMFPLNLRTASDRERAFLDAFNVAAGTIWQ